MDVIPIKKTTYRPCRHKPIELTPMKPPPAPKNLTPAERREWKKVARLLAESGVLSLLDLAALEAFVVSFCTWQSELAIVRKEGTVYQHGDMQRINPHVLLARAAEKQMRIWAAELGMTVNARRRIGVKLPGPKTERTSKLERYFERRDASEETA
jgi:P27 family predicted phage terminase small subunit